MSHETHITVFPNIFTGFSWNISLFRYNLYIKKILLTKETVVHQFGEPFLKLIVCHLSQISVELNIWLQPCRLIKLKNMMYFLLASIHGSSRTWVYFISSSHWYIDPTYRKIRVMIDNWNEFIRLAVISKDPQQTEIRAQTYPINNKHFFIWSDYISKKLLKICSVREYRIIPITRGDNFYIASRCQAVTDWLSIIIISDIFEVKQTERFV